MNKKTNPAPQLKEKDTQAIQSMISRTPNLEESELLARLNSERLRMRTYYEIFDRLDADAKRRISPNISLDNDRIISIRSVSINKQIKEVKHSKYWPYKMDGILEELILNSGKYEDRNSIRNRIHWTLNRTQFPEHGTYTIYHSDHSIKSPPKNKDNWILVKISTQKALKSVREIQGNSSSLFFPDRCLYRFIHYCMDVNLGIQFDENGLSDIKTYSGPGALIWWPEMEFVIEHALTVSGFESPLAAGTFQSQTDVVSESEGIQLSLEALDFTTKSFTHGHSVTAPELESDWSVEDLTKKLNWNKTLVKIIHAVDQERITMDVAQSDIKMGVGLSKLPDNSIWVSAVPGNSHFLSIDPKFAGQMLIADAVRQLTCQGIKAKYVNMNFWLPDPSGPEFWKGSELLEATDNTVRHLQLRILTRNVNQIGGDYDFHCSVHSRIKPDFQLMDNSFKDEGDFISLLGSHRGELGGSVFLREIYNKKGGPAPAVDLNMESRIQEVVMQGIQSGLIKSAVSIGSGGLAVAATRALMKSNDGLGARIHLSRKLREDELLFGETQGLVMISLGENDIMEFERICMTLGVPSTTMGRVTDTGRFTFNDLVDISVNDLKTE